MVDNSVERVDNFVFNRLFNRLRCGNVENSVERVENYIKIV